MLWEVFAVTRIRIIGLLLLAPLFITSCRTSKISVDLQSLHHHERVDNGPGYARFEGNATVELLRDNEVVLGASGLGIDVGDTQVPMNPEWNKSITATIASNERIGDFDLKVRFQGHVQDVLPTDHNFKEEVRRGLNVTNKTVDIIGTASNGSKAGHRYRLKYKAKIRSRIDWWPLW